MAESELFKKMAAIMGELNRVPKSGSSKQLSYNFVTDADVADTIRAALVKHNVAFFASMVHAEQNPITSKGGTGGYHNIVEFEYTFACGDTGQTMTARWVGESDSYDDKGIAKAATLAQKYFLLKTFVLSTGEAADDPDSVAAPETSERPKSQTAPNPRRMDTTKPPAEEPHWTTNPDRINKMVAWARETLWKDEGLTLPHTRNRIALALGVPGWGAIHNYKGTPDEAKKACQMYESDHSDKLGTGDKLTKPFEPPAENALPPTGTEGR